MVGSIWVRATAFKVSIFFGWQIGFYMNWSLIGMPFIIALSWTMSVAKKICVQTVLCVTLIYSQPISCECFLMEENKNSVIKVLPENEKIIIHGPPSNPPKTIGKCNSENEISHEP